MNMEVLSLLQSFFIGHQFVELAFIILVVFLITAVMKFLRQPLIIWYIIAGIILSASVLNLLQNVEWVEMFA